MKNQRQEKGYRKDYRPSADVDLTQVDKKYYTTFSKKGKPTKKEWDWYKNYFVHPIENKVIFRSTLEDIKTNINKWLKSRIKEYNEVGYDDIKSKKAAMKDTIGWLRDVQEFLKSSQGGEITELMRVKKQRFDDFLGGANFDLNWFRSLKKDNPDGYKEYAKKLSIQINDWIEKLSTKAYENITIDRFNEFN